MSSGERPMIELRRHEPLEAPAPLKEPGRGMKRRTFLLRMGAAGLGVSAALFGKETLASASNIFCCDLAYPHNLNSDCFDDGPTTTGTLHYVWYCNYYGKTCACCEDYPDHYSDYQCNPCDGPLC
jgi:hypothetical protein